MDESAIVNAVADLLQGNGSDAASTLLSLDDMLRDPRVADISLKHPGDEIASSSTSSASSASSSTSNTTKRTGNPRGGFIKRPEGVHAAEEHRHKGLFILRSPKYDALATRCWNPQELVQSAFPLHRLENEEEDFALRVPEFDTVAISGSSDPTPVLFVKVSPFASYLLAAIIGGLDQAPCAAGSNLLFLGDDSPNSLYTLFVLSNIQGPNGKVFTPFQTFTKHRDALDRLISVSPNNIFDFGTADRAGQALLDGLFVESAESADPMARFVGEHVTHLKKDAIIGVLLNSAAMKMPEENSAPEVKFSAQVQLMRQMPIKPLEQITLEPYFQKMAVLIGKKL